MSERDSEKEKRQKEEGVNQNERERNEETDKEGYVRAVQTLALSPDWSVLQSRRDC